MRHIATFALLVLVGACVTTHLTPEGERVRVTSDGAVAKDCKFIANVDASDRMNGGMAGQMAAEENAQRRLKNKVAEMGGNLVVISTSATGMSGSRVRGDAYACTAGTH